MRAEPPALAIGVVTPGAIGSNPRVVKAADALSEAGYRVTVVSTRTLDRVEARDEAVLARAAWTCRRLDLRSASNRRGLRARQEAARALYRVTGARSLAPSALHPFVPALTAAALAVAADLYIAHYPAGLAAAAEAARRQGAALAYDAEDFHPGEWPEEQPRRLDRRLIGEIEGVHLKRCAFVTAASPQIADAYARAYAIARPAVALNCFPLSQGPGRATPRGYAPGLSLYWVSQMIGPDRGLEAAARAIALSRARPHLHLRGHLVAGFERRLRALAGEAADRLHVHDPAPPDALERLAAAYDLGLAAETGRTPARAACLSNKLFSCLVAGVPPLMSATPAHLAFAKAADVEDWLFPIDDAAALAALIDRLAAPDALASARARAFTLAATRYNWETEKRVLLGAVDRWRAQRFPAPRAEAFA